jgi:hypothetical protein
MSFRDSSQDKAIDALQHQLQEADGATVDVLTAQGQRVAALSREVTRLNAAVSVLTQYLIERGSVDGAELEARFNQSMAQSQAQANLVTCARCRKQVDKRATMVGAYGTMCDPCHRSLSVDE